MYISEYWQAISDRWKFTVAIKIKHSQHTEEVQQQEFPQSIEMKAEHADYDMKYLFVASFLAQESQQEGLVVAWSVLSNCLVESDAVPLVVQLLDLLQVLLCRHHDHTSEGILISPCPFDRIPQNLPIYAQFEEKNSSVPSKEIFWACLYISLVTFSKYFLESFMHRIAVRSTREKSFPCSPSKFCRTKQIIKVQLVSQSSCRIAQDQKSTNNFTLVMEVAWSSL